MAVSSQERYDKLCAAWYNLLVQLSGYRLIRISDLGHTDVLKILSLPEDPTWSKAELNDGSWEFCMPITEIGNFRKLVRGVSSNAKIDLEYNPLSVPDHDVTDFGFPAAHSLNSTWLEKRVEYIYGAPKDFYMFLIYIGKYISFCI